MTTTIDIVQEILNATTPAQIFGKLPDSDLVRNNYKLLARSCHPDVNSDPKANDAFVKLKEYFELALVQIQTNTYNQTPALITLDINGKKLALLERVISSPLTDWYLATYDHVQHVYVSVSKQPKFNSYLKSEIEFISKLRNNSVLWDSHLPIAETSFISSFNGYHRTVTIFNIPSGYVPLTKIKEWYPQGIHEKDMAWIFRRLLDVLGFIHSQGYVHGNVTPSNILVGLDDLHQVKLVNFHSTVEIAQTVPFLDTTFKSLYPNEILNKEKVYPSTDIYMATQCMMYLLSSQNTSDPIHAFLQSCILPKPSSRPQDAWKLREEFTAFIDKYWGKREYRPLSQPSH